MTTTDPFADFMATVEAVINESGWLCQGVFPTADDPGPGFTYTVGFGPTLHHPELIVVGIGPKAAQSIFNDLGERIRGGWRPVPGQRIEGVVRGLPVIFVPVTADPGEYFGVGLRYYREHGYGPLEAWQMVWPDPAGLFPWEDGFDVAMAAAQPVLGDIPAGGN